MSFDDYNYNLLNDYVFNLVQSTIESEENENSDESPKNANEENKD